MNRSAENGSVGLLLIAVADLRSITIMERRMLSSNARLSADCEQAANQNAFCYWLLSSV